jgi:hypothetical protein
LARINFACAAEGASYGTGVARVAYFMRARPPVQVQNQF